MRRLLTTLTATTLLAAGAASAQTTAPAPAATPSASAATASVPQDAMVSGQIEDLDVVNAQNENVGEIEDVVISQGRVVGYIISAGGFLGMGDRNVLVEPSMMNISYNTSDNKWVAKINATKDQLKAAPEFKYEGRWKD
jgi:hypothetical protein